MDNFDNQIEEKIDAALGKLGAAMPPLGLEQRVLLRIAEKERQPRSAVARWFFTQRFTLSAASAVIACAAIVIGSVNHSKQLMLAPPGLQLPAAGGGVGAASAVHVAPQPVTPAPNGRARSTHSTINGRARVSPETQKPSGVGVPKTPAAPDSDKH